MQKIAFEERVIQAEQQLASDIVAEKINQGFYSYIWGLRPYSLKMAVDRREFLLFG